MNVTFDKSLKQRVWQAIQPQLYNDMCPFCGVVITGKNFAGAAWIYKEFRAFDGSLPCLLELAGEQDVMSEDYGKKVVT